MHAYDQSIQVHRCGRNLSLGRSVAIVLAMNLLFAGCRDDANQSGAVVAKLTSYSAEDVTDGNAAARVAERPGEDWASFLGPRGDGTSLETGVDPELWQPHPPLRWTMKLGVSYGGPTVSNGKLYQFDRFDEAERLTCFDAATAKELWQWEMKVEYDDMYGYNNGPRCSPVVHGEHVYTYGVSGQLSCIQVADGKEVWTKNLVQEYSVVQNFFGVASTPIVFGDLVIAMVGGSPEESLKLPPGNLDLVKPNGSAIVAFDRLTGAERYRLGDDLASYASMTVREIDGKPIALAFARSGLLGFEPETGVELFDYPWRASMLESVNAAVPVVEGNRILLSETYEIGSVLLELKGDKLEEVWKDSGRLRELSFRAHWATPVLIDGFLYGCSGRNQPDSDFRCVRFSDGAVQWTDRRHERSSALAVDGYLIVLGETGRLELIQPSPKGLNVLAEVDLSEFNDPSDGEPLLTFPCWAPPVLSHGLLYLRGKDRLVCFDLIPQ